MAGVAWFGTSLALAGGNFSPLAVLPKELLTVPALATICGVIGSVGGGFLGYWGGGEAGKNDYDFIMWSLSKNGIY